MRVIDGKYIRFKSFASGMTYTFVEVWKPSSSHLSPVIIHLFQIDISENDIQEVSMPSGIPFVYKVRPLDSWRHLFGNKLVRSGSVHHAHLYSYFVPCACLV